jgi:hypothetical protein
MDLDNFENKNNTELNDEMATIERFVDSVIEQDDRFELGSRAPIESEEDLRYITYNIIIYSAEGQAYFAAMELRKKVDLLRNTTEDSKEISVEDLTIQGIKEEISHLKILEGEARDFYFLLFDNVENIRQYLVNRKIGNVMTLDLEDL